jgi:hypothetical protein
MAAKKETKMAREARKRSEHKAKHAQHKKNGISARSWYKQ